MYGSLNYKYLLFSVYVCILYTGDDFVKTFNCSDQAVFPSEIILENEGIISYDLEIIELEHTIWD